MQPTILCSADSASPRKEADAELDMLMLAPSLGTRFGRPEPALMRTSFPKKVLGELMHPRFQLIN